MQSFALDVDNCPHTFGELLYRYRDKEAPLHLSQEALGDQLVIEGKYPNGVSDSMISRWELGLALPDEMWAVEIIGLIAAALRCTKEQTRRLKRAYRCDMLKRAGFTEF